MTTLADIVGYRQTEVAITRAFVEELQFVTEEIAGDSPDRQRDLLLRAFPELALPRVVAIQDFATTWAEDLLDERGVRPEPPRLALPAPEVLEATVRWAVAPLFAVAAGTVFANLAGAGQRYIADAGRAAVVEVVPARARSARLVRFPEPGACEWCVSTAGVAIDSHDNCHCVIAPAFSGDSF